MTLAIFLGLIGIICIYFEFFLPGGILAVFGSMVIVGSAVLFYYNTASVSMFAIYLLCLLVSVPIVCYIALKRMRRSARYDTFFLKNDQEGYVASEMDKEILGKEGIALTELKPSGHVRIGDMSYQAVSEGGYIHRDAAVEVIAVKGSHLVVKVKKKREL
jgi:membrane-bound ClpP family serine protease